MTEIPSSITGLTNEELRKQLIAAGIPPAPLTPTTRRLYQRKLAKKLAISLPTRNICEELDNEAKENLKPSDIANTDQCGDVKISEISKTKKDRKSLIVSEVKTTPTSTTVSTTSQPEVSESGIYYAVVGSGTEGPTVFPEKHSALKLLIKQKKGRLQSFQSREDAETYVKSSNVNESSTDEQQSTVSEKSNQFKMPKQRELNELNKAIENGDVTKFKEMVWENPRYLINSADAPVILKPGTRYNALHTAARSNQPVLVKLILNTLQDPAFQSLMYNSEQSSEKQTVDLDLNRVEHIVDLYFNTPDKILCETPLHFACKLGFVDVVSELLSHRLCCKTVRNKAGQTPEDVACSRQGSNEAKLRIKELLKDQFYVPLIRCHDNSQTPVVAPPWNPSSNKNLSVVFAKPDPLDPIHVVSAVAGPMTSADAKKMQTNWMTPDKRALEGKRMSHIRRSDLDRGDERIGRELAKKCGIPWMEYWEFLDNYADFSTSEGLTLLENFMENRFEEQKKESQLDESSVFLSHEDSLNDLCSNLCDMQMSDSQDEKKSVSEDPPLGQDPNTWWNISSTPSGKNKAPNFDDTNHATPQDKRLESLRGNLLKARQQQLQKVSSPTNNERHFGSPSVRPSRVMSDVTALSSSFKMNLNLVNLQDESFNSSLSSVNTPERRLVDRSLPRPEENESEIHSAPCKTSTFICGNTPSKLDTDVILAIGSTEISEDSYPHVWRWIKSVLSYSEEDRQRWKTPTRTSRAPTALDSPLRGRHTPLKSPWPASPLAKPKWKLSNLDSNFNDGEEP